MILGIIALLAILVVIFLVWHFLSGQKTRRTTKLASQPKKESYKAVRINPHQHACPAAFERHHRVYLVAEAPLLPLADCTKTEDCRCGYVHYDDRRQSERRGSSIVMGSKKEIKERRDLEAYGRRKTDNVEPIE